MPPKKNTSADTMEARIITLEEQFANLEVSLNEAQTRAETIADESKDTMKNLSAELKEQSARAEAELQKLQTADLENQPSITMLE
jgi:uncharacterized coiled-coil protein SlyX